MRANVERAASEAAPGATTVAAASSAAPFAWTGPGVLAAAAVVLTGAGAWLATRADSPAQGPPSSVGGSSSTAASMERSTEAGTELAARGGAGGWTSRSERTCVPRRSSSGTELGVKRSDPVMKGAAQVLLGAWREDGRIRPAPKGAVYPCHTANAARVLCRLGHARDRRLKRTFEHFFETQHDDGGWRCNTVKLGAGPATDASNPGVTLNVLDAFRFTPHANANADPRLDAAAKTLLSHWKTRNPLGPCSFAIGTLFGKLEYPSAATTCSPTSTSAPSTRGRGTPRPSARRSAPSRRSSRAARSSSRTRPASSPSSRSAAGDGLFVERSAPC